MEKSTKRIVRKEDNQKRELKKPSKKGKGKKRNSYLDQNRKSTFKRVITYFSTAELKFMTEGLNLPIADKVS